MQTIQACVNPRLLKKANRLFTGTLDGRIIEILQNARRAGATKVVIANEDDQITVRDNGRGIDDFAKLLDLGGSGWEDALEASEDPAGVGLFCLAPRQVMIRSNGRKVIIESDGWTGTPTNVCDDPQPRSGTILQFTDEAWTRDVVERHAVFSGLEVIVDHQRCHRENFVSDDASHHSELGCRIEVQPRDKLSAWHQCVQRDRWYGPNVLVNFHGQVVSFDYRPVSERDLCIQVDLSGEPTGIRLMLPARTRLVENDAYHHLLQVIEAELYRYIQRRGHHTLPYKEYLRAQQLGIHLPEAQPTFKVGLIWNYLNPEPVEVTMPKDFPLSQCYLLAPAIADSDEAEATNAHLLAALGTFNEPFVPVEIRRVYEGYSWAKLPTITKIELAVGTELHSDWVWSGKLACVDQLQITAHTSDGKVFASAVCMARSPSPPAEGPTWADDLIYVSPEAQERLSNTEIWYHLGGFSEDSDSYETQEFNVGQELDCFWANLIGPDEHLRRELIRRADDIQPAWTRITITSDGVVAIHFEDGTDKTLKPTSRPANPSSPGNAIPPTRFAASRWKIPRALRGPRVCSGRVHDRKECRFHV